MPDIVGGGGGYTQNGTWFVGAGYAGFWKDDHIRYRGVLGYGSINLKFYGPMNPDNSGDGKEINLQSLFFPQQGTFRIKDSDFFLGGKYVFTDTRLANFDSDLGIIYCI